MKRSFLFVSTLSIVAIAACRSAVDSGFGSATGNYTLVSVDGTTLPFRDGTTITVRGMIGLNGNGNFTLTQADSSTSGAVVNTSLAGQWSETDNAITLLPKGGTIELGIGMIDTIRLDRGAHQNLYIRK